MFNSKHIAQGLQRRKVLCSANQRQESSKEPMFFCPTGLYKLTCKDASCQILSIQTNYIREEDLYFYFSKLKIRTVHGGHILSDREEIMRYYKGPFLDAPNQILFLLAKLFKEKNFI